MLKTSKTINLSGNSIINDKQVVYMQANISTDGGTTSHSSSIQDKVLYEAIRLNVGRTWLHLIRWSTR